MYHSILLLLILCMFQLSVHYTRGQKDVVDTYENLNNVLETAFRCHEDKNPGVSISLVKNGTVLFTAGYGVTDRERKNNVTSSTLFNIASITKNVASSLLVKLLAEKTNLTVDSTVRELLGDEFQLLDDVRAREMTFADVVGHRTGVPPNNIIRFDQTLTRKNLLQHLAKLKTPDQFRVKYYYNNLMYGLATYISEVLGNSSWENLVTEHFLEPLGMSRTTFVTRVNYSREDVAWPYAEDNGTLVQVPYDFIRRWGFLAGAVSIVSSAEDMVKWMNFHLSKGRNSEGRVVMEESLLNQLYTPRMALPTPTTADFRKPNVPHTFSEDTYTLGLRRGYYRGYQIISHSGSNNGFRSLMVLLPTENIGAFIGMSGTDDGNRYRTPVHMYLVDIALGLIPFLNESTICTYPAPWRTAAKQEPFRPQDGDTPLLFQIQDYEGVYFNDAYGDVQVTASNTSGLTLTYGWGNWHLIPYRKENIELFYAAGIDINIAYNIDPIEFIREASTIVKIKATGFETNAPPVFTRVSPEVKGSNSAENEKTSWLSNLLISVATLFFVRV